MSVLYVLLLTALTYQLSIYTYNLLFHPLRHIPGRFWWRISRIPHELALIRGIAHHEIRAMHETYGDVVRVSPSGLSFIHPHAWNDIMVKAQNEGRGEDTDMPVKDMNRFSDSLWMNGAKDMLTADTQTHARQRQIFGYAFSERALRTSSEPLIKRHLDTLVYQLRRRAGEKMDLGKWFSLYNFEVISDFATGEPLGCLEEGEYHDWTRLLFESVVAMTVLGSVKQFPWAQSVLDFFLAKFMARLIRRHQQFSMDRINARLRQKEVKRGDMFDQIMRHDGTEKELSRDEKITNCNLMIAAGSDTTGAALTSCMFLLLSNPDTYRRLVDELRARFKKEEDITIESVKGFDYLESCMNEAMRIYPPSPNSNPRRGAANGSAVQGIWINSETTVGIYHWAANHCSRNFKNPEVFAPTRWLKDPIYEGDRRGIAKPFSVGTSNCIGQPLALILIRLAICRILFSFELELAEESREWLDQRAYWVWKKKPLWVTLAPVT